MRAVMTQNSSTATRQSRWARLLRPVNLGGILIRFWQTAQQRRRLAELDPRLLRDIGIDPAAAQHEINRPFWQLPEHYGAQLERRLRR